MDSDWYGSNVICTCPLMMFINLQLDANLSRDNQWIAYSSLTPFVSLSSTDSYHDFDIPLNFNESRLGISRVRYNIKFNETMLSYITLPSPKTDLAFESRFGLFVFQEVETNW
jgi:hypothetical protein